MVKTPDGTCASYNTLSRMDALEWQLAQLPGVQFTRSAALFDRYLLTAFNEGNPKWYGLTPNSSLLNNLTTRVPSDLVNASCSLLTLYAHLADHKADTLSAIVSTVEQFKQNNDSPPAQFLLAAGNAGIEAATNEVIKHASQQIMLWVYGAVILLCLATFRSWRAVVCVIIPLVLTSLLCEALMVVLGIGVKVTTLPVIALGVGIGVDYALYVMSITLVHLRKGESLSQAYLQALAFTGKVVMLTGITLGVSVSTWAFSTIKFQADMGVLLAFMFIWNMLGALVLVPSLSCFLLLSKSSDTTTIKIPQKATEDSGLF
jgi:predicted RND superfamily exporter protein